MRRIEKDKPLLDVGMRYVTDKVPNINNDIFNKVKEWLGNFIDGKISFDIASVFFLNTIGNVQPLEKINDILKISETPIPPPQQQNYVQSGTLLQSMKRKTTQQWSNIEDQRLLSAIHHFGLENWLLVSYFVGNGRTRAQCAQRWFRGLDPHISKFLWTKQEDEKLLRSIQSYGKKCWTKIAADVGTRSDAQCRYRYKQLMKQKSFQNKKTVFIPKFPVQVTISTPYVYNQTAKLPSIDNFISELKYVPNKVYLNEPPPPKF